MIYGTHSASRGGTALTPENMVPSHTLQATIGREWTKKESWAALATYFGMLLKK